MAVMVKINCKYNIPNHIKGEYINVFAKSTRIQDVKEAIAHKTGFFDTSKIFVSYITSKGEVR